MQSIERGHRGYSLQQLVGIGWGIVSDRDSVYSVVARVFGLYWNIRAA